MRITLKPIISILCLAGCIAAPTFAFAQADSEQIEKLSTQASSLQAEVASLQQEVRALKKQSRYKKTSNGKMNGRQPTGASSTDPDSDSSQPKLTGKQL